MRASFFTIHARSAAASLAKDDGAAGLIAVSILVVVAFSTLSIFLAQYAGPTRDLEKIVESGGRQSVVEASLMVHFHQVGNVPCPDTDQDGLEDACSGGGTTSGTLPWRTLGVAREDAVDVYGSYYTYIVADSAQEFCISVPNDYDTNADPQFTGETVTFDDLRVRQSSADAGGRFIPFAVVSHGKNRLGGIAASGNIANSSPASGSNEEANASANPTLLYSGPSSTDSDSYFDDSVWAPTTSELEKVCEELTTEGELNADLAESFDGEDGDVDQDKFETANAGTEVQQENGQAVFPDATTFMTTAAARIFSAMEQPYYISAEWTPDAAATNGGFSIVTRAEATPTGGVFDPGITFRFFDGTGAAGANTISIMDDGVQVAGFTSTDTTFNMSFGETYVLEVYDNGSEVWMQISQKSDLSNRASAYSTGVTGDRTGTRIAFVNGTAFESRLDELVVGRPMLAMDTNGTGHAQASGNGENDSTTGSVTLEGWFKPRSLPSGSNTATLISQWDSAQLTRSSHRLFMSSSGALSLSLGDGTVTTDTESLGVSITTGEWTHVAVTYDDEATYGAITVYINGSLARTITGTATSPILAGNPIRLAQEQFMVGADHAGVNAANLVGDHAQNHFDGLISDVRVWDDVRTDIEVVTWYDRRLPIVDADPALDNLVVNWRFDLESGGFAATQVEDRPSTIGDDGDLVMGASWAGALLNTHRTISTDVCDGMRVGAFRCDFRGAVTNLVILGENLGGIATFYAKAWGGGGGADLAGGASPPNDGGGGGFAGGLFLNTGGNITLTVGAGGASANAGGNGVASFLDQGAQRVTGARGNAGTNAGDGNAGTGSSTGTLLNVIIAPTVASVNRRPGCEPAIAVMGDPCSDQHYTITGAPVAEPGYGGDGPQLDHASGQTGAVILLW